MAPNRITHTCVSNKYLSIVSCQVFAFRKCELGSGQMSELKLVDGVLVKLRMVVTLAELLDRR